MPNQLITHFESSWIVLVALSLAGIMTLVAWGAAFLRIFPRLRLNQALFAFYCESLLLGTMLFSLTGFVGVLLGFRLVSSLLTISALAYIFVFIELRSWLKNKPSSGKLSVETSEKQLLIPSLAVIVLGSILWTINNLQGLTTTPKGEIVLAPWIDIFYHAKCISLFAQFQGDPGALNYTMHGDKLPLYHYGSYILSSFVSSLGGIPSLQVATSLYPLFGMLLTGVSIYMLTHMVAGGRCALFAVCFLFFLPDITFWAASDSRQNSYFFFQQVGIGGSYAVAVMGLALGYAFQAFRKKSTLLCVVSLLVFLLAGFFKMQIVLAYSLLLFLFIIMNIDWLDKKYLIIVTIFSLAIFFTAVSKLNQIPSAPTFSITSSGVIAHLNSVQKIIHVTTCNSFAMIPAIISYAITLLLTTYGIIFPLTMYLVYRLRKTVETKKISRLVLLTLISHVAIKLLISDNAGYGDLFEVNHKTFVFPYFITVFCAAYLLTFFIKQRIISPLRLSHKLILASLGLFFIVSTGYAAFDLQNWRSLRGYTNIKIDKGLFESSLYAKDHSSPGEVVQLCENDPFDQFGVLADRPVFIAHAIVNTPPVNYNEQQRFSTINKIVQAKSTDTIKALLPTTKISWLLMSPRCYAAWENQLSPVVTSEGYRLYNMRLL